MKQQNEILSQKANLYDNLVKQSMIEIYQQQMSLITDQISKVAQQGVQIEKQVSESKSQLSSNIIKLQAQMEKSNAQVSQNLQNETKEIQKSLKQLTTMESQQQSALQQIEKSAKEFKSIFSTNIINLQDKMEQRFAQISSQAYNETKVLQNSLNQLITNNKVNYNISTEMNEIACSFKKIIVMENQQQTQLDNLSFSNNGISINQKELQKNQQEQLQLQRNLNQLIKQNQDAIKIFNDESKIKLENIELKQNSQNDQEKNILDQISKLEKYIQLIQNEISNLIKNQPNIESSKLKNINHDTQLFQNIETKQNQDFQQNQYQYHQYQYQDQRQKIQSPKQYVKQQETIVTKKTIQKQ